MLCLPHSVTNRRRRFKQRELEVDMTAADERVLGEGSGGLDERVSGAVESSSGAEAMPGDEETPT